MNPVITLLLALIAVFALPEAGRCQSRELFYPANEKAQVGPASAVKATSLSLNADNPTGNSVEPSNTAITVAASLSNQQYAGVGTGDGSPSVVFGASGQAGSPSPKSLPLLDRLSSVGNSSSGYFSGSPDGQPVGIDVSANAGFRVFTSVRQFASDPSVPTGQRIYMADLTLTFSSPVSDPFIHLSGLGARIGALTYTTELELVDPNTYFQAVKGNFAFQVESTRVGTSISTYTTDLCDVMAGCGTVRLVGKNLTSVTFRVYVRGNGGAATWAGTADHNGDEWMIGVSLPKVYDLAGSVFLDPDGPAAIDGLEITEAGGSPLYVNLVDPTDMSVIGSAPVEDWGFYRFTGVPGAGTDHYLELSTTPGTAFEPAPSRSLPTGWLNVGEQLRLEVKPGHDGVPDGRISVKVTDFYYSDALFAIGMEPGITATVTGRVLNYDGRSLLRCIVLMVDTASGETFTAYTNSFGYFRFTGLPAGRIYDGTAMDKKRGVSQTTELVVTGDVNGLSFTMPEPVFYPQKRAFMGASRLSK